MEIVKGCSSEDEEEVLVAKKSIKSLLHTIPTLGTVLAQTLPPSTLLYFIPDFSGNRETIQAAVSFLLPLLKKENDLLPNVVEAVIGFVNEIDMFPPQLFKATTILIEDTDSAPIIFTNLESMKCSLLDEQLEFITASVFEILSTPLINSGLKILYNYHISDTYLADIPPDNQETAILLLSVFPVEAAQNAVSIISNFKSDLSTTDYARLLSALYHLVDSIDSKGHHTINQSIIHPYLDQKSYQEYIAEYFYYINANNAKIYCDENFQMTAMIPKLKASALRLLEIARVESFIEVTPNDAFECGLAMLKINKFEAASNYFEMLKGETEAEPYRLYSKAHLSLSIPGQTQIAIASFAQAANSFLNLDPHNNLQSTICWIKYYLISVGYQKQILPPDMILGQEELQKHIEELPHISLLLHDSIDHESAEFIKTLDFSSPMFLPPSAFYQNEYPITIKNLILDQVEYQINNESESSIYICINGVLENKLGYKIIAVIDTGMRYEEMIPAASGKFAAYFPLSLSNEQKKLYFKVPIPIHFYAIEDKTKTRWLITKFNGFLTVRDNTIPYE